MSPAPSAPNPGLDRSVRPALRRASSGRRRLPGAMQLMGMIGFLLLLAYIFSGQVRDAVLGLVLRLEASVANALGIVVRRSSPGNTEVDPLVAAVVLLLYGAASLYISKQQSDSIPSAADLLAPQAFDDGALPAESSQ